MYADLTDRLGSVRDVLDHTGASVAQATFDAWGNQLGTPSTFQGMYGWDGYDFDAASAFYNNHARYYDPHSERWISQDPMGFDAGDSNLYRYVHNAPTNATDPSGMADEWITEMSDAVEKVVEKMKSSRWAPNNPDNPGEFGNQVHQKVARMLGAKSKQWQFDIYVENDTNKILSIGTPPVCWDKGNDADRCTFLEARL